MYDYYRFRFRELRNRARRRRLAEAGLPRYLEMPAGLRLAYQSSSALVIIGWILAVGLGRGSHLAPLWMNLPVFALPFAVVATLALSQRETWSRPALILLIGACAFFCLAAGLATVAISLGALAPTAALYLYGSPQVREYYSALRAASLIQLSWSDFLSPAFVPLYTGMAGLVAGGALGLEILEHFSETRPN